jgi:hypothetical protein
MVYVKVVEGPQAAFGPGNFYWRLLEAAFGREVALADDHPATDLNLGSYHASVGTRVASSVDSALSRRLGRMANPVEDVLTRIKRRKRDAVPGIWITTENVRPPVSGWDLTLSFDLDSLSGTNQYCPLWWGEIALLPEVGTISVDRLGHQMTVAALSSPRNADPTDRSGFACAFINNPEPMRIHAVQELSRLGRVDVFGRVTGRRIGRKQDVARNYRYVLCFENDVYPGYVTEKPFEAWSAGCVPLWRGDDPEGYLDPEALINAAKTGIDGMVDQVAAIEADLTLWEQVASKPLLRRIPDLGPVLSSIRSLVP